MFKKTVELAFWMVEVIIRISCGIDHVLNFGLAHFPRFKNQNLPGRGQNCQESLRLGMDAHLWSSHSLYQDITPYNPRRRQIGQIVMPDLFPSIPIEIASIIDHATAGSIVTLFPLDNIFDSAFGHVVKYTVEYHLDVDRRCRFGHCYRHFET